MKHFLPHKISQAAPSKKQLEFDFDLDSPEKSVSPPRMKIELPEETLPREEWEKDLSSKGIIILERGGIKFQIHDLEQENPEHKKILSRIIKAVEVFSQRIKEILPHRTARMPSLRFHMKPGRPGYLGLYTFEPSQTRHDAEGSRWIDIYEPTHREKNWRDLLSSIAHEYGHDLFKLHLKNTASEDWSKTVHEDTSFKSLWDNLQSKETKKFIKSLGTPLGGEDPFSGDGILMNLFLWSKDKFPKLYLQLLSLDMILGDGWISKQLKKPYWYFLEEIDDRKNAEKHGIKNRGHREKLKSPPASPTTRYGSKDPFEAFAEAFAMYVTYGPRTVLPQVRRWMKNVMPNANIVTSQATTQETQVCSSMKSKVYW